MVQVQALGEIDLCHRPRAAFEVKQKHRFLHGEAMHGSQLTGETFFYEGACTEEVDDSGKG